MKIKVKQFKTMLLVVMIGSIAFLSCTYRKFDIEPCNGLISDTVSFNADVLPVFRSYCSTSGCHSGSNPEGNLNLEDSVAYDQLHLPGRGYINPTKPEFSVLYIQMISTTQPMPPTGKLDDCTINLILKWIEQGANNN